MHQLFLKGKIYESFCKSFASIMKTKDCQRKIFEIEITHLIYKGKPSSVILLLNMIDATLDVDSSSTNNLPNYICSWHSLSD